MYLTRAEKFTPPLIPSDQCDRNCSFVSGESASIFALFFAAGLMGGARWRVLLGTGLALGTGAGLLRMAQGGHYLSDVIFFRCIYGSGCADAAPALLSKKLFTRQGKMMQNLFHDCPHVSAMAV